MGFRQIPSEELPIISTLQYITKRLRAEERRQGEGSGR